jgi:kynureninase
MLMTQEVPGATEAAARDAADPLRGFRARFDLPDGLIYLDGNSLGALPRQSATRAARTVADEWGRTLIDSWNDHGWIDLPITVGRRIAPLIGAGPDEVAAADTVSTNLFKLAGAALAMRPGRRTIVTDAQNFPTDIYILEGLAGLCGGTEVRRVAHGQVAAALDGSVAVLCLSHVDYRSARIEDMAGLTRAAHAAGVLVIWDLSHSVGAIPVDLNAAQADFAVGCGYKYLNGGPGAPAFLFVARRHQQTARNPVSGWLGHAQPFAFDGTYAPADGIRRFITSSPPIVSLSILDESLKLFAETDTADLRAKSVAQSELLIRLVEAGCAGLGLTLASPRDADRRGSHVLFDHAEGYAVVQALKRRGVVGDFRVPHGIRLGIAPLYNSYADIAEAAAHLAAVLREQEYDAPELKVRAAVT